uniref:Uncharacterized protein n=1 Tax=Chromera velia CCMP2878 TaxID=1169474 RepID=A0A0G4GSQ0_9ALVE|eukprot:Cvel_5152.t1-p1 / transcript=Cvel_5152.t1 / gene=Cvel_5152 / organism=Chromera_velia_CCMP2878 / gene_product=hypothetical protein / transcript_product=hypothetical protein / location=Cvel_scaffold236:36896-37516(-) / protein_length=207 / sequence_SO=supercontig / SO=protein_coding / is_pseudo=false
MGKEESLCAHCKKRERKRNSKFCERCADDGEALSSVGNGLSWFSGGLYLASFACPPLAFLGAGVGVIGGGLSCVSGICERDPIKATLGVASGVASGVATGAAAVAKSYKASATAASAAASKGWIPMCLSSEKTMQAAKATSHFATAAQAEKVSKVAAGTVNILGGAGQANDAETKMEKAKAAGTALYGSYQVGTVAYSSCQVRKGTS